jgi:hypothetical protein
MSTTSTATWAITTNCISLAVDIKRICTACLCYTLGHRCWMGVVRCRSVAWSPHPGRDGMGAAVQSQLDFELRASHLH